MSLPAPVVAITCVDLPGTGLTRLAEQASVRRWEFDSRPTPSELADLCQGAQGLICRSTERIDGRLLDACPDLRVVSTVGVGYDNFDVASLDAHGVLAGNTPGVLTDTTADLAFALILAASRRLKEGMDLVRSGGWKPTEMEYLLGRDVYGTTLGIVGYGNIGRAVARRATGFAMEIQHFSRSRADDELSRWVPLDELLATSDIISIHTPLNEATRGLIGARELARMKPTAVLVNTSRGAVVDQAALTEALRAGQIFAAGLDVTTVEPTPPDDPILALGNCIVLPHIGSATSSTRARMVDLAVDNVLAGLSGLPLRHSVNDPARFAGSAFA